MHFKELVEILPKVHGLNQDPLGTPSSQEYQKKILSIFQTLINSEKKQLILNSPESLYDILLIAILQNEAEYIENLYSVFGDVINLAIENKNNSKNYYSPLILAIENNNKNIVELLVSKGVHDFTKKYHGMNALMTALSLHYLETAKVLLQYGAAESDVIYTDNNRKNKIINETIQSNLNIIKTEMTREESISPNPIRNPSPVPIVTAITDNSLADLFVRVYLKKYELILDEKQQTNFTIQVQKCINVLHANMKQKKLQMEKIINTLKTSDNPEIFELHTTPNTRFKDKFIALFSNDLQPEPPRIRTGRN